MRALSIISSLFLASVSANASCLTLSGGENYYSATNTAASSRIIGTSTAWANNGGVSGGTTPPGRTVLCQAPPTFRFIQSTWIKSFKCWVANFPTTNYVKLKVFRPNGSVYDFVSETAGYSNLTANATNTITLSTPMLCREGDMLGYFLSDYTITSDTLVFTTLAGYTNYYATGDITSASWNPTTHLDNFLSCVEVYGSPALAGYTGDSIMAGHNCGALWYPFLDAGTPITGTLSSAIPWVCQQTNGLTALFLNAAKGSQTYAWVASTGVPAIEAESSSIAVIHCGVNDISGVRTWAQVAADLDTCRALHARPKPLFVSEILPWTAGSDAQALTVRTWNTNLAGWCSTNAATMLPMHDALGKIRVSTGYLDDLATAYDQDGVHLKQAGVNLYAKRLYEALRRVTQ